MNGEELRQKRQALDLTQEQLAERLGVASNTVARWERGERTIPPTVPLALETVARQAGEGTEAKTQPSKKAKR